MKLRKREDVIISSDNSTTNKIVDSFVGRKTICDSFVKSYSDFEKNLLSIGTVKVINYYGISGIGKTRLVKELIAILDNKFFLPSHIYIDLSIKNDERSILTYIKSTFEQKFDFKFPLLDSAIVLYAQKTGENLSSSNIKPYIDKSSFLKFAFEAAEAIPVVGTVSQLVKAADRGVAYVKSLKEKRMRDIKDLSSQEPEFLYKNFYQYFIQDLNDNLAKENKPMVIFLDAYDSLNNKSNLEKNELWFRGEDGIVPNIQKVLWVIASKEKLNWEKYDLEWQESIEYVAVEPIQKDECFELLKANNISDNDDLYSKIYDLTAGIPYCVNLCIDKYNQVKSLGYSVDIESLSNLIKNYLHNCLGNNSKDRIDLLCLLSFLPVWDDEIVKNIAQDVLGKFSFSEYERIKDTTAIIQKNGDKYEFTNEAIKTLFQNNSNASFKNEVKEKTCDYIIKILQIELQKKEFNPTYVKYINIFIESKLSFLSSFSEVYEFFTKGDARRLIIFLYKHSFIEEAKSSLSKFYDIAQKDKESIFYALVIEDYSNIFEKEGLIEKSIKYAKEAYDINIKIYGSKDRVETVLSLMVYTTKIAYLEENYNEALNNYEFIFNYFTEKLGQFNVLTISAQKYLNDLKNKINHNTNNYKNEYLTEKSSDATKDNISELFKVAQSYESQHRYQDALNVYNEIYLRYVDTTTTPLEQFLSIFKAILKNLKKLGRKQEIIALCGQIMATAIKKYGAESPEFTEILKQIADDFVEQNELMLAKQYYAICLNNAIHIYGQYNEKTVYIYYALADAYFLSEEYSNAEDAYEGVIEMFDYLYTEKDPKTIMVLKKLTQTLLKQKKFVQAKNTIDKAIRYANEGALPQDSDLMRELKELKQNLDY